MTNKDESIQSRPKDNNDIRFSEHTNKLAKLRGSFDAEQYEPQPNIKRI